MQRGLAGAALVALLLTACSDGSPVTPPTIAPLALAPEPQVVLPESFVVGQTEAVEVGLLIDSCHAAETPTIDELGVRARLITVWQVSQGVNATCTSGGSVFVEAPITFYSAGTGTVVVRGEGEDGVTRDHEFEVEVLP